MSGVKLNYALKIEGLVMLSALADTKKANNILGWKSELSLKEALASAGMGEEN